jgi:hypothetical protein
MQPIQSTTVSTRETKSATDSRSKFVQNGRLDKAADLMNTLNAEREYPEPRL